MERVAARAEAVPDPARDGPRERERAPRYRPAQRPERDRSGDPVRGQAGPALEAQHRAFDVGAEPAVHGRVREPVPGEEELERRDVPPDGAGAQGPAAIRVATEAAERPAGPGAGEPVGHEAVAALEAADAGAGEWPRVAVDGPVVEAVGAERHLKRGDRPEAAGLRPSGDDHGEGSEESEDRDGPAHPPHYAGNRAIPLL